MYYYNNQIEAEYEPEYIRRGKLNSQFIVTARIDLSIFTKNFKFQSLLLLSLQ